LGERHDRCEIYLFISYMQSSPSPLAASSISPTDVYRWNPLYSLPLLSILYLFVPPPRYKRASAVCDISTLVNWQESHLLFRLVAPFWLLLVYKYVEEGYSKFFFLVGGELCLFELDKEDCRLDTTIVYILAELWVCVIGWRRSRRPHRLLSCLVSKMCQVFMCWRDSWGEQLLEAPSFFFHHQYWLCR
jgi:hypothetical protein